MAADNDDLTCALRRGIGLAAVQRDLERCHRTDDRLVVAFIDVDGLKAVNDSLGHAAGDRLLEAAAERIRVHMRPYDVIVRVGGDEFVCSLTGIGMDGVQERFDLVSADLAAAPGAGSISVGLAELTPGESMDDLIQRADAALLAVKGVRRRFAQRAPLRSLSDRARTHDNRGEPVAQAITRGLTARPEAVAAARRAVLELRLPRTTHETLALLVSELVIKSIHHAGLGPEDPMDFRLTHSGGRVRLAVHDHGPRDAQGCTAWCEVVTDDQRTDVNERDVTTGYVHERATEMGGSAVQKP